MFEGALSQVSFPSVPTRKVPLNWLWYLLKSHLLIQASHNIPSHAPYPLPASVLLFGRFYCQRRWDIQDNHIGTVQTGNSLLWSFDSFIICGSRQSFPLILEFASALFKLHEPWICSRHSLGDCMAFGMSLLCNFLHVP